MAWTHRDPYKEMRNARKRIGSTRAAQAKWLLRLIDLPKYEYLTSTQQEALRWELAAFLHLEDVPTEEETSVWFTRVQRGFNALNHKVKKWKQWTVRVSEYRTAVIDYKTMILRLLPPTKSSRDQIADGVYQALCTFNNLLARCASCKSDFIRVRRQQYCNQRCAAKARLRRFRENHKIEPRKPNQLQ